MNFNKIAFTTIFLTTLLTCSYLLLPEVMAQTSKTNYQQKEGLPASNRRRGTGSRGCFKSNARHLMALMPEKKQVLTKSVKPKLLFHLPKTSAAMDTECVIADAKHNPLYGNIFQTTDSAGIITVSLLESIDLDKEGKMPWYLSIVCNS